MENENLISLWNNFLNIMSDNIDEEAFSTWFKPLKPVSCENNRLIVFVPSDFFRSYIEDTYLGLIKSAIQRVFGKETRLSYNVGVISSAPASNHTEDSKGVLSSTLVNTSSNKAIEFDTRLDPTMTMDKFIVGKSNRQIYTIASRVIKGAKQFNPLFIYGSCGVGKTHISNAIGISFKENFPTSKVLYLTAAKFEHHFIKAYLKGEKAAFQEFFFDLDCLIIDDFQYLITGEKKATHEAFYQIFNELRQLQKQIIICCDRAPGQLKNLDDRLLSRFKSGLSIEIERTDSELMSKVLRSKIAEYGLDMSEECIAIILQNAGKTIRDNQGLLLSISARSLSEPITPRLVRSVIEAHNQFEKEHDVVTPEQINRAVCKEYGVTKDNLCTKGRLRKYSEPRQVAMFLIRTLTDLSLQEIGNMFSRDHSTVVSACKTVGDQMDVDKTFAAKIESLKSHLDDFE